MGIEHRLSNVLSEFAKTMVTDFPIQAILDHLVQRIVDVLPIGSAGVTVITAGEDPRYVAASDDAALRFERVQSDLGEGPCIEAFETGHAVVVPDLRMDDRFPRFTPRALDEGLGAVFTFPLRHGDRQFGALDLYRSTPGPLLSDAMTAAQTLADVTAAYILNAQIRAELEHSYEQTRHVALHDGLTGLANRTLLLERLERAVLRSRRTHRRVAIFFVDLDRLKGVNDAYGHHVGDQLLVAVAGRLTTLLRPSDTVARIAGDEFVVLCDDLDDAAQVEVIAARIDDAFAEPFVLRDAQVQVSASVGVALAGAGTLTPERALEEADAAMYQVKRRGGARHATLDRREHRADEHRAGLARDLPRALGRGELETAYQPIVATADGCVTTVEALLRWRHPVHGTVMPATAVALAEHGGLISEIGRWVLERALSDQRRWDRLGVDDRLGVCVNVSAHQLMAPDFADAVAELLVEVGAEPGRLTLEVTESVFLADAQRAFAVLERLKYLGVMLALDDFGTGFSSLSYLKRFPFDVVKIDRVFIDDLERDAASRVIVSAVVGLAHGLGMTVVAEGVETDEQYETVAALGCDACQGFLLARPVPAPDLDRLLVEPDGAASIPWRVGRRQLALALR